MQKLSRAFTLVELLIVIALLGVIATIVIAAINPIEQANRASDAGQKADASQLVSAVQRYYTATGSYPWQVSNTTGTYTTSDVAFAFQSVTAQDAGLCGADCKTAGLLITSNELQSAFLNKTFITSTSYDSKLYLGKAAGSSSSVFVCWVPKSQSNRQVLINEKRIVAISSGFNANTGTPVLVDGTSTTGCMAGPANTAWSGTGTGGIPNCGECVPE